MKIINVDVKDEIIFNNMLDIDTGEITGLSSKVPIPTGNFNNIILNFIFDNINLCKDLNMFANFKIEGGCSIDVALEKISVKNKEFEYACYIPNEMFEKECIFDVGLFGFSLKEDGTLEQRVSFVPIRNSVVKGTYQPESQESSVPTPTTFEVYFDEVKKVNDEMQKNYEKYQNDMNNLYHSLKKIKHFNSVEEMKEDNTLVDGYVAKTLGYYSFNDGGGATYSIRTKTDEDIEGNGMIYFVGDSLVAELVVEDKTNVKQFGAKGNNENDDTQSVKNSLNAIGYAYLPKGTYKISSEIELDLNQSIFGDNLNNTRIVYTGSGKCIRNKDVATCVNISAHDLTLEGTDKKGDGIYLYRTEKQGDAYHNVYNLIVTNFENGIYAGQYQNETKFNNITAIKNKTGINCYYLNDCYFDNIVTCQNEKDGLLVTGSSESRFSNFKSWYNGSADPTQYSNYNLRVSAALMFNNISSQESYGNNLIMFYCKNTSITNVYLSWAGLGKPTKIYQVYLEENQNCKIEGVSQNGHYGEEGYDNYILAVKNHPFNCEVKIKTEEDFPTSQKLDILDNNNNFGSVFTRNIFNIESNNLKINKNMNYAINGNLANKQLLTYVNNNSHCSIVDGKLQVSTVGETASTNVYFKISKLPREDFYTSYIKFKKVSGSGKVIFDNPAYATLSEDEAEGTEYLISYTKNITNLESHIVTLTIAPNIIVQIEEFGLLLGESGQFNNPMSQNAIL